MKRLLSVSIAVHLCLIASAAGQSLGELAKKEKERQQKVEGKSEVLTENSLREAEGLTVSTMGESAKTTSSGFRKTVPRAQTRRPESGEAKPNAGEGMSGLIQSYSSRVSGASAAVKKAENDVATCGDRENRYEIRHSGSVQTLENVGRQRCAAAKKRLRKTQKALKQATNECMNEARKMGIVPGDSRRVCYPSR